jgi:hypothetical protein
VIAPRIPSSSATATAEDVRWRALEVFAYFHELAERRRRSPATTS